MPPDPVIGALAFVGLVTYSVIGAVVTALILPHIMDKKKILEYSEKGMHSDASGGYFFGALLWPAFLAGMVVIGVLAAPLWCGGKVSRYLTQAQLREG